MICRPSGHHQLSRVSHESYAVSHGTSVYVFDAGGDARLLWPDFHTAEADIEAAADDLARLIDG